MEISDKVPSNLKGLEMQSAYCAVVFAGVDASHVRKVVRPSSASTSLPSLHKVGVRRKGKERHGERRKWAGRVLSGFSILSKWV